MSSPALHPHRRRNALTGDWLLVSPHRVQRPWQGRCEPPAADDLPPHDPECYLCAGNRRANGERNPEYTTTFVFENDFPALLPRGGVVPVSDPLFCAEPVRGTCRVICFSPRHDLSLARLPVPEIRGVVDMWAAETTALGREWMWVQIFENKGEMIGCSNPHPHGQIWACDCLPNEIAKEDRSQFTHFTQHGSPLLLDYSQREQAVGDRVVVANAHWIALVPYWATWPFEVLLLPTGRVARLPDLTATQRDSLAAILQRLLTRYDNLFESSFPYSMGWHGAPFAAGDASHWQLHAHFYPPLLRSATVKKFMVGYEMMAEPQRDLAPEAAAARLRSMPDVHYTLPDFVRPPA